MDTDEKIKLFDALTSLTLRKVLMLLLGGVTCSGVYLLWEQRMQVFSSVISSPVLLAASITAVVILLCAALIGIALQRVEIAVQARLDDQKQRIDVLQGELRECRTECRGETMRSLERIILLLEAK